jgi:hypothetical protein
VWLCVCVGYLVYGCAYFGTLMFGYVYVRVFVMGGLCMCRYLVCGCVYVWVFSVRLCVCVGM